MKLKKIAENQNLTFYTTDDSSSIEIPLFASKTSAGFPSPADDYLEMKLDINKHIINNPDATFYVRVEGTSMIDAGINDGALLVVDRSLEPSNNAIAICSVNGEFTVKRLMINRKELYLLPENKDFQPMKVSEFDQFQIWGVVTYIIQKPS